MDGFIGWLEGGKGATAGDCLMGSVEEMRGNEHRDAMVLQRNEIEAKFWVGGG